MRRLITGLAAVLCAVTAASDPLTISAVHGDDTTPCPLRPGSAASHAFDFAQDAQFCRFGEPPVGATEGNLPEARYGRVYNVYCPGTMTAADRLSVAQALINGTLTLSTFGDFRDRGTPNPIPRDYQLVGLSDRSPEPSPNHRYVYQCGPNNRKATHIKFGVRAHASDTTIAESCRRVKASSFEQAGKQVDYEFKCRVHFLSGENAKADRAAIALMHQFFATGGSEFTRNLNLKACVLNSSDFQCAPCKSTDKLVVRVHWVRATDTCPSGTIDSITRATF